MGEANVTWSWHTCSWLLQISSGCPVYVNTNWVRGRNKAPATLLLLLLKKVSSARLGESDKHRISAKTPAPQYQPIDRKKRKGKRVEDCSRGRAALANKEALALLLKPASPTPSKTELARAFQRDTEKEIKVLLCCKVLQRGCETFRTYCEIFIQVLLY